MTRKRALLTGVSFLLAISAGYLFYSQFVSQAAKLQAVSTAPAADAPRVMPTHAATRVITAATADIGVDQQARSNGPPSVGAASPLAVFRDAATQHPAGVDPMIVFGLGSFSDEQIAAYNELHVIPFNPAVGKLCDQTPDPQFPGKDFEIERCETLRERPSHPYTQLDDEALQTLAEADAAAALVMGMRVVGDDEARNRWYLRAAALSGKSGPVMALANRRYASAQWYKHSAESQLDLVGDVERVRYRAVLETIAGRMGDPRANPAHWRSLLIQQTGETASADAIERDALAIMGQMARIQRDITGSTQMWELINAA